MSKSGDLLTFIVVFFLTGFIWTDYSVPTIVIRLVFAAVFSIGFSKSLKHGMKKGEKKSSGQ